MQRIGVLLRISLHTYAAVSHDDEFAAFYWTFARRPGRLRSKSSCSRTYSILRCLMFYRKVISSLEERTKLEGHARLALVPRRDQEKRQALQAWPELATIAARRCAAFFAEAAVLVLVFGVLDFFMQHGHIEGGWVAGALCISVGLLAASVGTEFSARRWLGAHP